MAEPQTEPANGSSSGAAPTNIYNHVPAAKSASAPRVFERVEQLLLTFDRYQAATEWLSSPAYGQDHLSRKELILSTFSGERFNADLHRAGLFAVLNPWGEILNRIGGERASALAPWTVAILLQTLFPALDNAQGVRLAPLIKEYANDLSLAQWVTALSLPRHEHHGSIKLRELREESDWQSLAEDLRAALPQTEAQDETSMPAIAKGMARLGATALLATVAPSVSVPVAAVGATALLAGWAKALHMQAKTVGEDLQYSTFPGMPSMLARRTASFMSVLLPTWGPDLRASLVELWWNDPDGWTLLDVVNEVNKHLDTTSHCAKDALIKVAEERKAFHDAQRLPTVSAAETLHLFLSWFFSDSPSKFADGVMGMARKAGMQGDYATVAGSVTHQLPMQPAAPLVSAKLALGQLVERHERQANQERLQIQIDQLPERTPGESAEQRARNRYRNKVEKSRLQLRQAQFSAASAQRNDDVKEARERLDKLLNHTGYAAKVHAGDIAGAMAENAQAAQQQDGKPADTRIAEASTASQAPSNSFPSWLSCLLPIALAFRGMDNAAACSDTVEVATTGAQLLGSSAEKIAAATAPAGLIGGVRRSGVQPRNIAHAIFDSAAKLAAHGAFVLGGSALGNYLFDTPAKEPGQTPPHQDTRSSGPTSSTQPEPAERSDKEVIELAESTIVALPDGSWASAFDVLSDTGSGRSTPPARILDATTTSHSNRTVPSRSKRSIGGTATPPPASPSSATRSAAAALLEQRGIQDSDLDAIMRRHTPEEIQARRQMEMALIGEVSETEDYAWLKQLTPAEQRLWLAEGIVAAQAEKALKDRQIAPDALLDQALRQAKWLGPWQDIQVQVIGSTVDGISVDDRLPLLQYCLYRKPATHPIRYLRDGLELTPDASRTLNDVLSDRFCKDMASTIHSPLPEDKHLRAGLVAKFTQIALKEKAEGMLTSSGNSRLGGADIVLGFINNSAHIEASGIDFNGLEDIELSASNSQAAKTFTVPNYLVLRSKQSEPNENLRGQVVLYRSDLQSFTTFTNEDSFRQFIGDRSLTQDLAGEWTFKNDVIRAAPPEYRGTLRKCLFDQRYLGSPAGWLQQPHIVLNFKTSTNSNTLLDSWARDHLDSLQKQARQQFDSERIRWNPVGVRAQQADADLRKALANLKTWPVHAQPEVTAMLNELARRLWVPEGKNNDLPDMLSERHRIDLQIGNRKSDLTRWATEGWQQHGPKDTTGFVFPSQDVVDSMEITVYRKDKDGNEVVDIKRTRWLNNVDFLRNLCYSIRDLVNSNRLGQAYMSYLQTFKNSPEGALLAHAMAEAIRWRTRGLIDAEAGPEGILDAKAHQDLLAEHAKIGNAPPKPSGTPAGTSPDALLISDNYRVLPALIAAANNKPSTLLHVFLNGFPIEGLWAMSAGGRDYIFMLDGPEGDGMVEIAVFEKFLREDRHRAESFINSRAAYRYHAVLADAFGKTQLSNGIKVTLKPTLGPSSAARVFIEKLMDNTDEFSVSNSESLQFMGGLLLTGLCIVGTGGLATGGCALGTLLFVVQSITNGLDSLDRGDRNEAIAEFLGAGTDVADVFDLTKIAAKLFKLGMRSFKSIGEATEGMRQLTRQASAFDEQGVLGSEFAQPLHGTPQAQTGADGNPEWLLDGKTYVSPKEGQYVEAPLDEHGIRRAKDPLNKNGAPSAQDSSNTATLGAPIDFQGGKWQRLDKEPDLGARFVDQVHEKIPESKWADNTDLKLIRAVEGVLFARQLGATGQKAIVHAGRKALIEQVATSGQVEKLEGTSALLATWAATPEVNGGMRVDILPQSSTGTPHIKLGRGSGALISVPPKSIPELSIDTMIEHAGRETLATGLKLGSDVSHADLKAAVIQRLQKTISSRKGDMLDHWEGIEKALTRVDSNIKVVRKHYPGLTIDEASELLIADRSFSVKAQRGDPLGRTMANIGGRRHQRTARTQILEGKVSNLDEVNALSVLLQDAFPGFRTVTTGHASHIDLNIERVDISGKALSVSTIRFSGQGEVKYLKDGIWIGAKHWNEAVDSVLSDSERLALGDRGARGAVEKAMTRRPLGEICPLLSRAKRSDCELQGVSAGLSRVSLSPQEQIISDELHPMATTLRGSVNKKAEHHLRECRQKFTQAFLNKYPGKNQDVARLGYRDFEQLANDLKLGKDRDFWKKNKDLAALDAAFGKKDRLIKANFVTAQVNLQYKGHDISFSGHYSSSAMSDDLGLDFQPADKPLKIIVKATKKTGVDVPSPSPKPSQPGALDSSQFYVDDADRERLMTDTYLFGTDAWQLKGQWQGDTPDFTEPRQMTSKVRQYLKNRFYDSHSLAQIKDGDYFYEATIRACSESSFLNHLWNLLAKADPQKFARGTAPKDFSGLTGAITLFTESKPCPEVCSRRIREMMREMPNVDVTVGYAFDDPGQAIGNRRKGVLTTDVKFFEADSTEEFTIGAFQ
ncbi:MAG TPA: hypothetical protein VIM98_14235 [Dyella sp.]|uniref:hypothetical protein n=1 Tax=Dyella sp. TaxID=1869338 RepID=UPI002F9564FE